MNILVTGANGFLARHIIERLCARGWQVRAMVRPGASTRDLHHPLVELVYGNFCQEADAKKAMKGCTHVIHTAADTDQSNRNGEAWIPVNVTSAAMLFRVAIQEGCRRFVFISTANTIGFGNRDRPGDESLPPSRVFAKSGYAQSKVQAEAVLTQASLDSETELVILNPGFIIGPKDYHPNSGRIFGMITDHRFCFYPPGGKSFIDVRDAAMAVANSIENGKPGEKYLLTGPYLSFREFFEEIRSQSPSKTWLVPLPPFILAALGRIFSLGRRFGLYSNFNKENAAILCSRPYYSNRKAAHQLGLLCRPLAETIRDRILTG